MSVSITGPVWTDVTNGTNVDDNHATDTYLGQASVHGGKVHLRGALKLSGALTSTILCTLPASHRPSAEVRVPIAWYDDSATGHLVTVAKVATTGVVTLPGPSATPAANDIFFLDGISFDL